MLTLIIIVMFCMMKITCQKKTPLFTAAENGRADIVFLMLKSPRVDIDKMSEINIFKHTQDTSGTQEFEKKTPLYHIKKYRKTVLHFAVQNNETEMVRFLLTNSDIDVNIPRERNTISYRSKCKYDEDDELSDVEYIFKCDQDEDGDAEKKQHCI